MTTSTAIRSAERHTYRAELRVAESAGKPKITGYAAVFSADSLPIGGQFVERLQAGCFTEALKNSPDVLALFNHSADLVLGRTTAGTLRLSQDSYGLAAEIDPPDTQWARDLMVSMKRGDIHQMSFAFTVAPGGDSWSKRSDGKDLRTITAVDQIFDASVVSRPAYPQTSATARQRIPNTAEGRRRYLDDMKRRWAAQDRHAATTYRRTTTLPAPTAPPATVEGRRRWLQQQIERCPIARQTVWRTAAYGKSLESGSLPAGAWPGADGIWRARS